MVHSPVEPSWCFFGDAIYCHPSADHQLRNHIAIYSSHVSCLVLLCKDPHSPRLLGRIWLMWWKLNMSINRFSCAFTVLWYLQPFVLFSDLCTPKVHFWIGTFFCSWIMKQMQPRSYPSRPWGWAWSWESLADKRAGNWNPWIICQSPSFLISSKVV